MSKIGIDLFLKLLTCRSPEEDISALAIFVRTISMKDGFGL